MNDTSFYSDSSSAAATDRSNEGAHRTLLDEYMDRSPKNKNDSALRTETGGIGLPSVDFTGFNQEAEYKSNGRLDSVWHTIKHIFFKDETVGEKVRESIKSKMTPEERKQYGKEEEALEKHRSAVRNWQMQMTLEPGPCPKAPDTPTHDAVRKRLEQAEQEIEKRVRAQMSPEERKALDKEMAEYKKSTQIGLQSKNPLETGGFQPLPTPGPAIKEYYKRIAQAAEVYLQKH
ncbi:MAG: hypothetical protein IT342_07480 [Candidatus Melainabacteria bacterium]|nr:hypothetical protein [Candidatus Melainabacteria bacterium]